MKEKIEKKKQRKNRSNKEKKTEQEEEEIETDMLDVSNCFWQKARKAYTGFNQAHFLRYKLLLFLFSILSQSPLVFPLFLKVFDCIFLFDLIATIFSSLKTFIASF